MTQITEFTAKHFKIICMYIYIFQELIRKYENYEERNEKEQKGPSRPEKYNIWSEKSAA